MRVRRIGPVVVALSLFLSPGAARAQSDEDKAAARALATQGAEAFSAGRFDETVDLLTRAEKLVHAPTHLLLLARAQAKLGRVVAARETYLKIIREELASNAPAPFKKAQQEAKDELAGVEPKIASLRIVLQGAGERKVTVKLDDQPVSDALIGVHRPTDPGKHVVVAYPPGLSPIEASVTLGDGEKKDVKIAIPTGPLPTGVPGNPLDDPDYGKNQGAPATPDQPEPSGGGSPLTIIGLIGAGVGLAGVGVGVAFTVIGGGTQSDADAGFESCSPSCTPAQQDAVEALDSDAASQKTIGLIGLIGGGALLAGGAVLTVLGLTSKPEPAAPKAAWVAPYVAPNGFGVHGAF